MSAARGADKSVGGHVGVGGPALLALETLLVVSEGREFSQRLEELLLSLPPAGHVGARLVETARVQRGFARASLDALGKEAREGERESSGEKRRLSALPRSRAAGFFIRAHPRCTLRHAYSSIRRRGSLAKEGQLRASARI